MSGHAPRGLISYSSRTRTIPGATSERKHATDEIWSVWIGIDYRALGFKPRVDEIVWFWIGSHTDYDKLLP
jgi:hypothetical protein